MSEQTDKAISYGATGAAVGSAFGPAGTAIGGGLGAGYGYLTGGGESEHQKRLRQAQQYEKLGNMGLPGFDNQYGNYGKMADRFGSQDSSFRGDQLGLGNILAQEASGNGVGQQLVGMQARQAADRASNQQYSALGAARPGMQAMASRNAMLGSALAQSAVGEQAALGSANMTLGAQGQYANFLQGARAGDQNQQQVNSQAELEAYRQRLAASQMQQQGNQYKQGLKNDRWMALMAPQAGPSSSDKALGALGGALSAYNARPGQKA